MKRAVLFAVVVLMIVGLAGFAQVKNPGTLTMLWTSDLRTMDPAYVASTPGSYAPFNLYDRLLNYKGEAIDEFIPGISRVVPSVENGLITQAPDGRVFYTFPIETGVYCHQVGVRASDGTIEWKSYDELTDAEKKSIVPGYGEITPSDVKYSLLRAMLLGFSWMSNAITDMFTGSEYPDVEAMALALGGVETMDEVDDATEAVVYNTLADKIAVRDDAVEIVLDKPFPATLGILALPFGASILDQEWAVAQGAWDGVADTWIDYFKPTLEENPLFALENGSGPFQLEEWDRAEKKAIFKRFEGYFREPASLERVVLRSVTEWTTRRLQLEAGDADIVSTPVEFLDEMQATNGVTVLRGLAMVSTTNTFFLWPVRDSGNPNLGSGQLDGKGIPPDFFSDIDVRKGFCYAMDYDALINQIHLGNTEQARGPIVKGIMGYRADSPVYSYDPEKAKEHFMKAWGGEVWEKGFKLTAFYIAGNTTWQSALGILQQNLSMINPKFQIEIQGVQWSAFSDLLWGGEDPGAALIVCNWGPDYSDPGGPLGAASYYLDVNGAVAGFSGSGYVDLLEDKFQPLLDEAWALVDPAEREPIYAKLQEMSYDYATSLFMWQDYTYLVERDWVHGYTHNAITYGAVYFYPMSKGE